MLKKQNFGVEIEFTGITRKEAAHIVAKYFNTRESRPSSGCYHTQEIRDRKSRFWKIMRDSSINPEVSTKANAEYHGTYDDYRCELVTPILQYEDIEDLQEIVRKIRKAGGKANTSCGIHVHVDGANHTPKSLRNLMEFMVARQDLVNDSLANAYRARWCKPICKDLLKAVKAEKDLTKEKLEKIWYSEVNDHYYGRIDHSHYNETRYHGLNLHAFFSKGTVEFRLFNGTLHAGKIKAYVQFCLAVSSWAITTTKAVSFRSMDGYTPEKKVTIMINVLRNRLGLTGDEFKTCRQHMLTILKKNAGMRTRAAA